MLVVDRTRREVMKRKVEKLRSTGLNLPWEGVEFHGDELVTREEVFQVLYRMFVALEEGLDLRQEPYGSLTEKHLPGKTYWQSVKWLVPFRVIELSRPEPDSVPSKEEEALFFYAKEPVIANDLLLLISKIIKKLGLKLPRRQRMFKVEDVRFSVPRHVKQLIRAGVVRNDCDGYIGLFEKVTRYRFITWLSEFATVTDFLESTNS